MSAPAFSSILVGTYGEGQLGDGWHERERDPRSGIPFRASDREATFVLKRTPGARGLHFLLSGPCGMSNQPLRGSVRMGSHDHRLLVTVDGWVWRSFPLPPSDEETLEVTLATYEPVVPDKHLQNGDDRLIGWFVSAIWQE